MLQETAVQILQQFYRIYIKTEKEPLDPITGEPIQPHLKIKIVNLDNKKPSGIQYFNLETLDVWFKTRKEPINPLTNLEFTEKQLQKINEIYEKNDKKPFFEPPRTINKTIKSVKQLLDYSKDTSKITDFINLLLNEHTVINLNTRFISSNYFLDYETVLTSCVLNDNIDALEELLFFNPDLNLIDPRYNLKAVDLAAMSTRPNSTEILKRLLYHGALANIHTKKGFLYEVTSDVEKLNLIYQFCF